MDTNETVVTENVTENVEQTTEQIAETLKTYSQEDVDRLVKEKLDQVLPGKIARSTAKVRREYEQKYGDLENVLRAGTGKNSLEEITESVRGHYQNSGIDIPAKPVFSGRDLETLASADAQEIIDGGYDEVVAEVERLAAIGLDRMNDRERTTFKTLAEYRLNAERMKALAEIGVTEAEYNSPEFKAFAGQFLSNVPITDVYKLYAKTSNPNPAAPIGSMKNGSRDTGKTYYSPEDVDKLMPVDYDDPVIFQRVRESMKQW